MMSTKEIKAKIEEYQTNVIEASAELRKARKDDLADALLVGTGFLIGGLYLFLPDERVMNMPRRGVDRGE